MKPNPFQRLNPIPTTKPNKPMKTRHLIPFAAIVFTAAPHALALTIPWDGNGTNDASGTWSTANLWDTDAVPGSADTAVLTDVTSGTRTVTFDTTATSPVQQVDFDQTTAGATNLLDVQKNLTVTNLITLGAAAGTERISIGSTAAAGFVLTPSGGITLDAGGNLVLTATANTAGTGYTFGNLGGAAPVTTTIQGGTLTVAPTTGTSSAGSASNTISGNLTMTSGALTLDNAGGGNSKPDRRLLIQGTVNVSGGAISSTLVGANGNISFQGASITLNPTSFDTDLALSLDLGAAQSLSTDKTLGNILVRSTDIKTVTSSASGSGIGQLQLFDGNSAISNSRTTFKLGSNLTLTTGKAQPAAQSFGNTHESGRIDLGIDTNGNTLDLSAGAASGVWTPNISTQSGVTNTVWDLSGGGTIKANGLNLSAASITTNIGANTKMLVTGGDAATFHLGTNGTIDPTAILRYSGSSVIGNPALMTTFRDLSDIEVTSGALRLRSFSTGTLQDLRVSGGTMDLDASTARSFTTISLTGGTLANGTFASAETDYTGLEVGTVSGKLTGTGKKLIKNSAGTLTLSSANDYSGKTYVQSGTLAITTTSALASTPTLLVTGGTLDLGGLTLNKYVEELSNGGIIQNGNFERATVTGWVLADGTISANLTTTGIGEINLTKSTAGTVLLSGANNYVGNTTVSAGTLTLSNAPDPLNANPGNDASTVTIAATGATLNLTYTGTDKVDKLFIGATQLAAGTYGPSATNIPQITGSGTLTVASGPAGGFTSWITGTFANGTVPGGQQGTNADPDNDGISNLVEYAILGQDPTVSNATVGTLIGNTLTFSKRLPLASDITYAIEESTDLGIDDAWANVVPTVNDGTTISYTLPGGPAKDFQRLKITQP
jgi:autotransporter-associated beta strand protein